MSNTAKQISSDMRILAPRKVLDALNIKAVTEAGVSEPEVEDPDRVKLFTWKAEVIVANKKKYLVAENIATGYSVAISISSNKTVSEIESNIFSAFRTCLFKERINPFNIQGFNSEIRHIKWVESDNEDNMDEDTRKVGLIKDHAEFHIPKETVQHKLTRIINRHAFKGVIPAEDDHRSRPHCGMAELLSKTYGYPPYMKGAYNVTVKVPIPGYKLSRSLLIPRETTFRELHSILQTAFGWSNSHLHNFTIMNNRRPALIIEPKADDNFGFFSMAQTDHEAYDKPLVSVIGESAKLLYTYDFGDNWEHVFRFNKYNPDYNLPYATCTKGQGVTPPEDVGGPYGFLEFNAIIDDPENPEYEEMMDWGGSFKDRSFDIDFLNEDLRLLYEFKDPYLNPFFW